MHDIQHDSAAAHVQASHSPADHSPLPYGLFVKVWVALLLLTCVTVASSLSWPGRVGTAVAMAITPVKAALVLFFFMHLKYEPPIFRAMFLSAVAILAVFMGLTFFDYLWR
jgi:cytochrome c oxidase subunit 4